MEQITDNMQKYANYKEQMGRLSKALTQGFFSGSDLYRVCDSGRPAGIHPAPQRKMESGCKELCVIG